MSFLQGPSVKQAEVITQEWNEGPGDLERAVRNLQDMLAASPYLPEPTSVDTQILRIFMQGCRMNTERARKKLESYFVMRSRFRDLYEYISLSEPPLSETCKFMDIVPLPKVTNEGYRVTIIRIKSNYTDTTADIANAARAILLILDVRLHDETLIAGDVFIWEVSNMRASLAAKIMSEVNVIRRSIYLAQVAYPQRMKRIHVVGARPFLSSTMQLIRSSTNEKIKQRFFIHANVQELLEYIPSKVLPKEWGGEEESVESLARQWRHRVDDIREYLLNLKDICNTTPAPVIDTDIYGTAGAFRKLDID